MADENNGGAGAAAEKPLKKVKMLYKGDTVSRLDIDSKECCFEPGEIFEVNPANEFISELIEQGLFVKPPKEGEA